MNYFITGIIVGMFAILLVVIVLNPDKVWHDALVAEGHAEYNSTTGVWYLKEMK